MPYQIGHLLYPQQDDPTFESEEEAFQKAIEGSRGAELVPPKQFPAKVTGGHTETAQWVVRPTIVYQRDVFTP